MTVLVVVLGIGWWYLFLGSQIADGSSEIIAGEDGTRSLAVYFSRTGEIPNTMDAVASATPNSNQAVDGSDTEAAAKMIQELRGMSNEHGGGGLFAYDEGIMGWLFSR